jgi:GNAT superfamily N-acetyltransferase
VTIPLFTVRFARPHDAQAISELETQCIQESKHFRGSAQLLTAAPMIADGIGEIIAKANHALFVIETSGEVCGFAHLEISSPVATVRRVFVRSTARDLGAGATLIEALRTHARSQGCTQIDAYALPGDRLTKNLFERAGMKTRLLIASSEL